MRLFKNKWRKSLVIFFGVCIGLSFWTHPVNASSKCHSSNGKADSICTSRVTNPKVTQANIHTTICISGYTTKIRPSTSYTNKLKKQQIKHYVDYHTQH